MSALLEDKVALVSGVGPGLGTQIARALARHGARVALAARSASGLARAGELVREAGAATLEVPTDITDEEQCRALVERCIDAFGRLDCLVNNAATSSPQRSFAEADLDQWRHTMEVNLFGSLQMTQAAVPAMRDGGGGSIVFVNTMSVHAAPPRRGDYTTSKGALLSAARTLARELGGDRIRVNSVIPGWLWGPPVEEMFRGVEAKSGRSVEQQYAKLASRIPLGFVPTDEDCADAVVFFASDLSRVVTGQSLDVNGGEILR